MRALPFESPARLPESTAGINLILQALDPAFRKAILIHYLNDLFA